MGWLLQLAPLISTLIELGIAGVLAASAFLRASSSRCACIDVILERTIESASFESEFTNNESFNFALETEFTCSKCKLDAIAES